MKRLTLIIMAGLLMLGLTQCKKEQTNTNANAEGEWVTITVKVDAGDRHIVYPGTGAVVYSNGDKIYVGNNGHYVGTLTYNDGAFKGQIQSPSTTDYLHFYFIGGEYTGSLTASTTSFDWSIADQSEKLPVLSYGHSTQKYTDGNATYGCTLENQCALVEFSLTQETSEDVTVADMLTTATVSFATPGITPTATTGSITLYSSSSSASKWAILLPSSSITQTTATIGSTSYDVDVPAVAANGYVHGDNAVAINNNTPSYVFTVDDQGTTVQFSPGNLQYNGTTKEWRFAEHQWDAIEVWDATGWVDLFGWGTWTGDALNPTEISPNASYEWDNRDFEGVLEGHDDWRTMDIDEWEYLITQRDNAENLCAPATVNGQHGVVILPDNWTLPEGCAFVPGWPNNDWIANDYDENGWASMASAGAVFLPAAGVRVVSDNGFMRYGWNEFCTYWSSTSNNALDKGFFQAGDYFIKPNYGDYAYYGSSVRLVRGAD